MDSRPVVFFDSGIGSLPYGAFFHSRNPNEKLICVADRANFPYGPKPREQVVSLVTSLTRSLINRYDPKIIAVICNSASVSAIAHLRETFPYLPFVGTVPAIKPAIGSSKAKRVGVLGTERTISDPYISEMAVRYGENCKVIGEAAPGLVEFAEHRYVEASEEERLDAVKPWVEKFKEAGVDALVLGCTHFLLLLNEFRIAAGDDMMICDSLEGVNNRLEFLLDEYGGKLRAFSDKGKPAAVLALTGGAPPENYLLNLAEHFGFEVESF